MTDFEKAKIAELRSQGMPFSAIAKELGLPSGTVNTFCSRHHLTAGKMPCRECFNAIPAGRSVFCSKECSDNWWKRVRNSRYKRTYAFTCKNCGKVFTRSRNYYPSYCSHECYIRHRFGGEKQ